MDCLGSFFGSGNGLVCRSINELRRCAPILLHDDNNYLLVYPTELLDTHTFTALTTASDEVYLLLTAHRARFVGEQQTLLRFHANSLSLEEIRALLIEAESKVYTIPPTCGAGPLDGLALRLTKLAKLLPSAMVIPMALASHEEMELWCRKNNIIALDAQLVAKYSTAYKLDEVCRADLHLKDAVPTKIIVFRSYIGEPEHYAIVIGEPELDNVVTRLHSSCYTGDLLGSLACDCRSQLLNTVDLLSSTKQGGIILYVSQEGRGIGMANKIRTYNLQQTKDLDTVDANRFLGFDDDERVFQPAACMLNHLGVSRIQLLTNNPNKAQDISKLGIEVTKLIPLQVKATKHNNTYMTTKKERLGHIY